MFAHALLPRCLCIPEACAQYPLEPRRSGGWDPQHFRANTDRIAREPEGPFAGMVHRCDGILYKIYTCHRENN